ncbi:hypothetical protein D3C84_964460 [compost metagenome]
MVGIEVPARVEHIAGFAMVGADTGIDLTALSQPHRAHIGFAADVQPDPRRLEDFAQHVPAQAVAVGGGIVFPIFAGQMNHRWRGGCLLRLGERTEHRKHHRYQPASSHP